MAEQLREPGEQAAHDQRFILQWVQPALLGLMDGSVSTLAPIFAAAGLTGQARDAFLSVWPRASARGSAWGWPRRPAMTALSVGAAARSGAA